MPFCSILKISLPSPGDTPTDRSRQAWLWIVQIVQIEIVQIATRITMPDAPPVTPPDAPPKPAETSPCRLLSRSIPRVVLSYAAFAGLWILLSDIAVEWLFTDPAQITLVSTLKGGFFVAVTSLLLYGLMRRIAEMSPAATVPRASLRPGLFMWLLAAAILTLTAAAIGHTLMHQREKEVARLSIIADLKVRQIADWLKERQGDTEFVRSSPFLASHYTRWQRQGDIESRDRLIARLDDFRKTRGFDAISVLNDQGERLWGSAHAPLQVAPPLREAARQAAQEGAIRRVGPYRGLRNRVRLDFVVPLQGVSGKAPLIVLHVDPADWLDRTLQFWPGPSASGETLLFRREGERVIFLNELRHRRDTAAKLHIPLRAPKLLASQVMRGEAGSTGLVEGEDYRGVASLGEARAVPGTDWFLMAKIDRLELYEEAIRDVVWIVLAGVLALFMAGTGVYLLRQRQQLLLAVGVQQAQADRLKALQLLSAIADSSNDAIFAKDLQGRYILFNRAACDFVGKPLGEVLGRDARAVFPAEQAEILMQRDREVVAGNRVLNSEDTLDTPTGQRVFLSTKGPLRGDGGQIVGTFGIFRDITGSKLVDEAFARLSSDMQATLQAIPDLLFEMDETGHYHTVRSAQNSLLAAPETRLLGHTVEEMLPPEAAHTVMAALAQAGQTGHDYGRTICLPLSIGMRWFELSVARKSVREGLQHFIVLSRDITDRKNVEASLLQSAEELRQRNAELERFNRASVGRELDMIALKKEINALAHELGRAPPYTLDFLNDLPPSPGQPS